ncbi:hypothetical protein KR032_007795 [Drosophila birchii]|nr:hypothetical protein KR032_007795 [Drosophila birchii]
MFSQLISSQMHDLPATSVDKSYLPNQHKKTNSLPHISHKTAVDAKAHRRSTSNLSEAGSKFFSQFSSKYSSQLIEKFIRSELLNSSYDSLRCQKGNGIPLYSNLQVSARGGFDCLQGSYRNNDDGETYEIVQVNRSGKIKSCGRQALSKEIHHQNLMERNPLTTLNTGIPVNYPARKPSMDTNTVNQSQSLKCMRSSETGSESKFQRDFDSSFSGTVTGGGTTLTTVPTPERFPRRRLLQMISSYDLQNKHLQRELAKEKRRRTEELACVIKSLLLFEAKLKNDLKSANQRMLDRDVEICRLTRLTRILRKRLKDQHRDEGMIAEQWVDRDMCLVPKDLQCSNCRKRIYDIDIRAKREESAICSKAELDSSSDDRLSSSFCGVRRSVRYTSKRTAGTFRDYIRARAMNIENPALDQHSEENTSSVSHEDSQTSYEHLHKYVPDVERLNNVKLSLKEQDMDKLECSSFVTGYLQEKDDIFFPAQQGDSKQENKTISEEGIIIQRRFADFSEASPKQIYETTTDDWYASASDQEESSTLASKPYGRGAVNPVLECVNQILLQQSMEETMVAPKSALASQYKSNANLLRRSSSGRRTVSNGRKRVHFSTKNSMVHVPLHTDQEEQVLRQIHISCYRSMAADGTTDTLNYGSIYSNEYEPIGSERTSNLYVDMAATFTANASSGVLKTSVRLPPALPPKPANLLKFQKSPDQLWKGQQKDENDCGASITASEPDYCSISEVGLTRNCVQIVVDVHKAQESNSSPVVEPKAYAKGQGIKRNIKPNDEIKEIFSDIPKLPNVAAIIAPKQTDADTLINEPKASLRLHRPTQIPQHSQSIMQYKRKQVPNIIAEINKRISLPNSPTTSKSLASTLMSKTVPRALAGPSNEMSIQAEFDWYNLDAEYHQEEKNPDMPETADEYNLEEEFQQEESSQLDKKMDHIANTLNKSHLEPAESHQMVLNLANFDGSGLSTKPLPFKRKTYLNAPIEQI